MSRPLDALLRKLEPHGEARRAEVQAAVDAVRHEIDALQRGATAVVGYWDSLDAVSETDPRPTEDFKAGMDARIEALRHALRESRGDHT